MATKGYFSIAARRYDISSSRLVVHTSLIRSAMPAMCLAERCRRVTRCVGGGGTESSQVVPRLAGQGGQKTK